MGETAIRPTGRAHTITMTEKDIIHIIREDEWMMSVLRIAEGLHLPDWVIGAGFVRSKVWDHLHGYTKPRPDITDIDLVYYDPHGNGERADNALSERLTRETELPWEIVNEFYAHVWNGVPPYTSTEDALSCWPETATAVGVTLNNEKLKIVAPYGIADLVNLIVRPSPKFAHMEKVRARVAEKKWLEKWPKLELQV